ncbi:innexin inx1 [Orussus abietinus]|uniref:innexin inx1 n=1 Tax=Orussus abietinus TaxID=222816 RepID=UPI000625A255|nr:innexin inx1 [Orussus abietinus]XP_012284724.1 innexin inx1 [Orussus abietinus]XP_012284733.1 innexin inx1 [Orussus abietinus]XP_012284743.1 innexin inx1 [Orussus abietinus]XP_012284754.1 innexin inx1 [Orussus abietinus]XP_012284762.1 innexin inx1 [Orussus abietinus]
MYKLLGGFAHYLKWQDVTTDSMVFRMHNLFTTVLLLTCSVIITATQYVGNPISCIVQGLPTHAINTYCWITSTFTMPDAFNRQIGVEVAHPGVANDFGDFDARKYYTYYQWVCFVLFFQAMLCYVPHWLWNAWEGSLISTLVMGLNHGLNKEDVVSKKKGVLMDYLMSHIKRHNTYVYRYFVCEVLCLVNILTQLYLMNRFFDGEFLSYGLRVVQFSDVPQEERVDPMVYVFPRVTKCIFHKYGASGTIQKHDSLCILPLNIVNEKTYIFIWFWFVILSFLLVGLMLYRAAIIFLPVMRPRLLQLSARVLSIETCRSISKKLDLGDWWILYVLSGNMDSLIYRDMLQELTKKMGSGSNSQAVNA